MSASHWLALVTGAIVGALLTLITAALWHAPQDTDTDEHEEGV
jgi:hypothetical protein